MYARLDSPLGPLLALATPVGLSGLYFLDEPRRPAIRRAWREAPAARLFRRVARQLAEYLAGDRRAFDLPLGVAGTPFQSRVWRALLAIPYGEVTTYGAIARRLAAPAAARAVGAAVGRNPIGIVIPCHRVVGAAGGLTGYGGGLGRKRALLELEGGGRGIARAAGGASPRGLPRWRAGRRSDRRPAGAGRRAGTRA